MSGFLDVTRSEKNVDLLVVMDGRAVVVVANVGFVSRRRLFLSDSLRMPLSPNIRSIA